MTATNHTLTGTALALLAPNPWLGLPLAFGSHFVLDSLPHYGDDKLSHTSRKFIAILFSDMTLAALFLVTLLVMQPQHWLYMIAAGIAAASPDLMWLPHWLNDFKGRRKSFGPLARFHAKIQWSQTPRGAIIEVIWAAVATWALVKWL